MANRRHVLKGIAGCGLLGSLPHLSLASTEGDARLVLVILRGALDGLAVAAPYADSRYASLRGELALPGPGADGGVHKLDGLFGLHPALESVAGMFREQDALIVQAVASPYRRRSHFDGQDLLENGGVEVGEHRDGWLNRALRPLGGSLGSEAAIALSQNLPLVLRGDNAVSSWAPSSLPEADDSTIVRLQRLYANDEFFATRLEQALRAREIGGEENAAARRRNDAQRFRETMASVARFLTSPDGPRVAATELGGWDTHANQGTSSGALANRLASLDAGLAELRSGLGDAWQHTAVAVVTEFGRTVRVNGTRGTDHGTGTAALLLGGAITGGRVICDWPGLRDNELLAGRDLSPTTDLRSLFKGLMIDHLGLDQAFVDALVFPDSTSAKPLEGLV